LSLSGKPKPIIKGAAAFKVANAVRRRLNTAKMHLVKRRKQADAKDAKGWDALIAHLENIDVKGTDLVYSDENPPVWDVYIPLDTK
jgi:hypothetical protein